MSKVIPLTHRASRLVSATGGGDNIQFAQKSIRFAKYGCANRPFYHIVVMMKRRNQKEQPIEQLGTYDPMPNIHNEKLVSFNFERVGYWLGEKAVMSKSVAELLGLAGFLPIHPNTYLNSWRRRQKERLEAAKAAESKTEETEPKANT